MYCFAILLFLVALISNNVQSYRILGLFPHPGVSHFYFFQPIMKALAEKGHDVTVVSHFPNKIPIANYKDEPLVGLQSLTNAVDLNLFSSRPAYSHLMEFFMLYEWGFEACDNALNSTAIKNVLITGRREPYDLVIAEMFNTDCMLGVAHKLNAPVIGVSSTNLMSWHYERVGVPVDPSYIPVLFMGHSDNMSFRQRISNWFTAIYMNTAYRLFTERKTNEQLIKRFGGDIPSIRNLARRTSMIFTNTHYSLSGPKPFTPAVVELGGIHIQKPKALDHDLQDFLDSADNGVIYISWGSMIRAETLPDDKREAILHALGKLKQKVLWKWENDTLPNQPPNVFIRKWLPQREVLCHPKVRVFMTHAGLLGSSEAAFCGVPVVSTPMYGDQYLNAAALENRGMGVVLPYEKITKELVFSSLRKALDARSSENAKIVQKSFKNRPLSPVESAVWWSEYVILTNGAVLTKSHSVFMNWYTYYSLDVYFAVISIIFMTIISWIFLIKKICGTNGKSVKKSNIHHDAFHHGTSVERKTK